MTRSEAIEAAAREAVEALTIAERRLGMEAGAKKKLVAALALPPDPDWKAIAHQLAAALRASDDALAVAEKRLGMECGARNLALHALALMPTEPKP